MPEEDIIICDTTLRADTRFHDGGLRHVKGACCYQVVRASRNEELSPEGLGNTYNHAPMLTYFHERYYYEYLSSPVSEHEAPSAVYLCSSADGVHWETPKLAFPAIEVTAECYQGPKKECITSSKVPCIVHHRMGFYTAKNGVLLMMTFYGISPDAHQAPNNGYGVGRVVREIRPDGSLGEIYFLRYNEAGGYGASDVDNFPFYKHSNNSAFLSACEELLLAPVAREQWWEEERLAKDYFKCPGGQAMSYYTLQSGRINCVFKNSLTSASDDGGLHFLPVRKAKTIVTSTGKVWGQRTPDEKYLLAYNPTPDSAHRWPLAASVSDDGIHFEHLMALVPEISPCRYEGKMKNLGAQYVRGITEANDKPKGQQVTLAYSVNKEDMWVCTFPTPLLDTETKNVNDDMGRMTDKALRANWNLYVPAWNTAELVSHEEIENARDSQSGATGSTQQKVTDRGDLRLRLTDCDPYDRTRAMRLFAPAAQVSLHMEACVCSELLYPCCIYIEDKSGQRICRLLFYPDHRISLNNIGYDNDICFYEINEKNVIDIQVDCVENSVVLCILTGTGAYTRTQPTAVSTKMAERIVFATKDSLPWQYLRTNGKLGNIGNLPGADEKHRETVFDIYNLSVQWGEE